METHHPTGGTGEDGHSVERSDRPTSGPAPTAAPRSPMIVIMVMPLDQSRFPFRAANLTPKAVIMSRRRPMVNRGGYVVILP